MRKTCVGLVFLSVVIFFHSAWVNAQTYDIVQITSIGDQPDSFKINDSGLVAWVNGVGYGDTYAETICIYDSKTGLTDEFTDGYLKHYNIQINGKGQVVWEANKSPEYDYEIFLYDSKTKTLTQFTDNDYDDTLPNINNKGQIVWFGNRTLFFYDGKATKEIASSISGLQHVPDMNDKGQVVWQALVVKTCDIFLYDNVAKTVTNITNNNWFDDSPQLSEKGEVVWIGADESNEKRVFYYDGKNSLPVKITYSDNNYLPQINDKGQMTWYALAGTDYEIFVHDVKDLGNIPVTSFGEYIYDNMVYPKINNRGEVVWFRYCKSMEEPTDIFVYEIKTNTLALVDEFDGGRGQPEINDKGQIVWIGEMGQLFIATPIPSPKSTE